MRSGSLLLRLLLSLVLALNGVATAIAATHVPASMQDPVAVVTATPATAGAEHGHCHDGDADRDADVGTSVDPAHGHDTAGHAQDMPAGGDCCESGACRCDCVPVAHAALPAGVPGMALVGRAHMGLPPGPAHPAPALPEPVRPPIA